MVDATNVGLVLDCEALLSARDTLAGISTLNWSPDTAITEWEGITVRGTPARVAWLDLRDVGLNGSVPAELGSALEFELSQPPCQRLDHLDGGSITKVVGDGFENLDTTGQASYSNDTIP